MKNENGVGQMLPSFFLEINFQGNKAVKLWNDVRSFFFT